MDKPESICTCKQCKRNFPAPNKRFSVCSPECQAILDAAYVRPPRPTITLTCQHCGITVTRKEQRYDHGKYCSRPCSYAAKTVASEVRRAKAKEERKKEVEANAAKRKAEQHAARVLREALREADKEAKAKAPKIKDCVICVGEYDHKDRPHPAPVCSKPCFVEYKRRARKKPGARAAKYASKARRRMLEKDALVEKVDPIAVFERDGWKCYICGKDTPRELRGTNHDDAPELEHKISLFNGGDHSYANTACACRRCNGDKGLDNFY